MADLSTTYMGLPLANPLIAGSSTQTASTEKIKTLEAAGAGAVVLRSIFEEQVRADVSEMIDTLQSQDNPEAYDYIRADYPMQIGPEKYLETIRESKAAVRIPVIASLNCTTRDHWISYARKIELAGADALELNVYDIPQDPQEKAEDVENRHLHLVEGVVACLTIPVAVKIGPNYTAMAHFIKRLTALDIQAVVMFNRFFQPVIDIAKLTLKSGINLSGEQDVDVPVRWIALLRKQIACDIAMTTGVHQAEGAIKGLLAGANVFQICSALYKKSEPEFIHKLLVDVQSWMGDHGFATLNDFRGRMAEMPDGDGGGFARAQYVKGFLSLD